LLGVGTGTLGTPTTIQPVFGDHAVCQSIGPSGCSTGGRPGGMKIGGVGNGSLPPPQMPGG
jgi:hypothetical protein